MSEIVHLAGVGKWVAEGGQRVDILRNIDLTIQTGDYLAIMGPSGSGKSSLLSLIGLLDRPSVGSVWMFGQEVTALPDQYWSKIRARSIGFIFQMFHLLPYLTVRENIALPFLYAEKKTDSARVNRLLDRMNLQHRANAFPTTLSGGERQRVAIARALVNGPGLILADEPTGSLDSKSASGVMEILDELNREGTSLILITHDQSVANHAKKIVLISDGSFR